MRLGTMHHAGKRDSTVRHRPKGGVRPRLAMALVALGLIALAAVWGRQRVRAPTELAYAVELEGAARGQVDVTLQARGPLPRRLRLEQPGGLFHDPRGGATVTPLAAWNLSGDGRRGAPLVLRPEGRAWTLIDAGPHGAVVQYRLTLPHGGAADADIRAHLSRCSGTGARVAGFHVFLLPEALPVGAISVRFVGAPGGGAARLAVPWPGAGSPDGIVYAPRDVRDLTDALVAWDDLRLHEQDIGGCTVRLGVRGTWAFADRELARLLLRLGEAEIAFFGSPPHRSMLILVDSNPLRGGTGFEYYGLHVGHSVLLLLDPALGWNDLADKVASVAAHEMFHGWLGEEICPQSSDLNWFIEGATSWYTARLLVDSGVWTARRAEEVVMGRIAQHYAHSPLRGRVSIAEAARGMLRDGETTRFAYAGGTLAAERLDAWLAERSGRTHPLDAVLRDLFARRGEGPLTRERLERALRRAQGADAHAWLDRHVYGIEPLPCPAAMF